MSPVKLFRALFPLLLLGLAVGCATTGTEEDDADASASELYQEARRAMRGNNDQTAIERLETLQSRYPFSEYAQQAQLDIIYLYFETDQWEAAVSAADRFMRLNPTHPRVDYALYMRGSANMASGQDFLNRLFDVDRALRDPRGLREAFADFQRLVREFPDSEYAIDARERMDTLRNQLARHELAIARFYYDRAAYVAAANRAKGIVESFQGTPAVPAALEIMAEAYRHLELPELRAGILRVIREKYPDHPLAKQSG